MSATLLADPPVAGSSRERRPDEVPPELPRRPPADYFDAARSPVASLLFVLPFLAIYEVGVHFAGPAALLARNPADTWMRLWLLEAGWSRPWALPALVVGTLTLWETVRHYRAAPQARINGRLMVGMLTESVFAAWTLVLTGQVLGVLLQVGGLMSLSGLARGPAEWAAACVGAGLYEEILFRLWGLPAIYLAMRLFLVPGRIAVGVAVLLSSLVFAIAHYFGGGWENTVDVWFGFAFRTIAGAVFAGLLLTRGFGVAVGAHIIYDATVLMLAAV